jgi:hypothetical protein
MTENFFSYVWDGGYYEGNPLDYFSVLHATYLRCVKSYVKSDTTALEIGPGKGAWTSCMLSAKDVWCIDALPVEDTQFAYTNIDNIKYVHVHDYLMQELPDNYFSYAFSYGCLCHVPFEGIEEYARNMFAKLLSGADVFWMVADDEKHRIVTGTGIPDVGPGHWYNAGIERTCNMLKEVGYQIVESDVKTVSRDPVIYFKKASLV